MLSQEWFRLHHNSRLERYTHSSRIFSFRNHVVGIFARIRKQYFYIRKEIQELLYLSQPYQLTGGVTQYIIYLFEFSLLYTKNNIIAD